MRLQFPPISRNRAQAGFTLIELMITVAIIGILAAIASPAYFEQMRKGRRAAAQSVMQAIAPRQEQYLLEGRTYATDPAKLGMSASLAEVAANYTMTITINAAGDPPYYQVLATAIGAQATDGNLTLDSKGVKAPATKWK